MKKIDEKTEREIVQLLRQRVPYSTIAKKYKLSKSTVSDVKKRNDVTSGKLNSHQIREKRHKREAGIQSAIVRRSEAVVSGIVAVLEGLDYSISELREINEKHRQANDQGREFLQNGIEVTNKYIKEGKPLEEKEARKFVEMIYKGLQIINDEIARDSLRVKAIDTLGKQHLQFAGNKELGDSLQRLKTVIDSFFEATNILDDKDYEKFKQRAIELGGESVKALFTQWERKTVESEEETTGKE